MEFITIDVIEVEQQQYPYQGIITLPMNPIINSYSNKHPMKWEIIHRRLLHPYDSFMTEMCHHQTLTVIPKHLPKKLNTAQCKIFYIDKMTTFPKGETVEKLTSNQKNFLTSTLPDTM